MNCDDVIQELSNFLDGELTPALVEELESHLDECWECKLVVNQTKKTIELFCNSELVELPKDVRSRLHNALQKRFGEGRA
ncbi:MAG TPA: zf-HC2 domain-containing protein, partial [Candidatus Methylomirabilis sp.]|nr:zf-HC2 domain-containing protein [Candidatus Methylomirabilis sp.]